MRKADQNEYEFIHTWVNGYAGDESLISHKTNASSLGELVEAFEQFLKGCGYCFHSLEVNIEDPNEDYETGSSDGEGCTICADARAREESDEAASSAELPKE